MADIAPSKTLFSHCFKILNAETQARVVQGSIRDYSLDKLKFNG